MHEPRPFQPDPQWPERYKDQVAAADLILNRQADIVFSPFGSAWTRSPATR